MQRGYAQRGVPFPITIYANKTIESIVHNARENKMANKKMSKAEKEQAETARIDSIQVSYGEYVKNIEARIHAGETITLKSYEDWIKKTIKLVDGLEIEVPVKGDSGETRHQRFERLANTRMTKALAALDMIMNLSSAAYESSLDEQAVILNTLQLKVLDIEKSFSVSDSSNTNTFSLQAKLSEIK